VAVSLVDDMSQTVRTVNSCRYVINGLCCPHCKSNVELEDGKLRCPVVGGCGWIGDGLSELAVMT
jgi:hypothetical protein